MTRVVVPRVPGAGSSQVRQQQQQQQGSISRPQHQQETQEREAGEENAQSSLGNSSGQNNQYCQFYTSQQQQQQQIQEQQQQQQESPRGSIPSLSHSPKLDLCDASEEGECDRERGSGGGSVRGGGGGLGVVGSNSGADASGRASSRDRREESIQAMATGTMAIGQRRFKEGCRHILNGDTSSGVFRHDVAASQPVDWLPPHQFQHQQVESSLDLRLSETLSRLHTVGGCQSDQGERRIPTPDEPIDVATNASGSLDDVAWTPPSQPAGVCAPERDIVRQGSSGSAAAAGAGGGGGGGGGGANSADVAAIGTAGPALSAGKSAGGAGSRRLDGPSTSSISRQPSGRRSLHSIHTTPRPSARSSPAASRCSSPRGGGDGDGYNSADEYKCSWNSSAIGYGGPDYDEELERKFETELKRARNLEVRRILPDGNCLFRAVADQVYGDQDMHNDARQMCIDYMEKERDHFSQFVTESFTAYCKRKRKDKVHGNNLEMQAMAEMYNRPIQVFSYSTEPINIFHGNYQTDLPPILLSYHRGNHYNSLFDPSNPTVGAGLGFGNLRGRVDKQKVKAAIKAQQDEQIEKAMVAEGRYYSDLELTEKEIERAVMEASRAEYLAHHAHPGQRFTIQSDTSSSSSGGGAQASSSRPLLLPLSRGSSGEASERGTPRSGGIGGGKPLVALDCGASAISPSGPSTTPRGGGGAAAKAASAAEGGGGAEGGGEITQNVRMLMSMGFSYLRVMEAQSIFHDHLDNMLCFLLESEAGYSQYENMYKRKGKAVEK